MELNTYQQLAARTINPQHAEEEMRQHAIYGLPSEVGELLGLYQKMLQGHNLDLLHIKKELGDILWFIAEYCTGWGWELEDIAQINIDKLKERYPEGFSEDRSLHRKEGDV